MLFGDANIYSIILYSILLLVGLLANSISLYHLIRLVVGWFMKMILMVLVMILMIRIYCSFLQIELFANSKRFYNIIVCWVVGSLNNLMRRDRTFPTANVELGPCKSGLKQIRVVYPNFDTLP